MKNWAPVTSVEGVTFTPWTDGWAVGFRVTRELDDKVEYVLLNPSSSHSGDGDMEGRGDVFLYATVGDDIEDPVGEGEPLTYVNVFDPVEESA